MLLRTAFLGLLVSATGCTMRFEAVDANTREPIAGVTVVQRDEFDVVSGWFRTETITLAPTGNDGSTIAWKVLPQRNHFFRFSKAGYAEVVVSQDKLDPSVVEIDQPGPSPHRDVTNAAKNPIKVPMYPSSQPSTTPALSTTRSG